MNLDTFNVQLHLDTVDIEIHLVCKIYVDYQMYLLR